MSFPYVPASRRKHDEKPGVADWQRLRLEDLVCVESRQRHLRCADQVEIVVGEGVHLLAVAGKEPGAIQGFFAHQHRRNHRGEAFGRQRVEGPADQRHLHEHRLALQVGEPRSRYPYPGRYVDDVEGFAQILMITDIETEPSGLSPAFDLDVVLIRFSIRR